MTQQAIEDSNTAALRSEEESEDASSGEALRSRSWEEHELRELFREEVNEAFNVLRSDVRRIQSVLPQLEEVMGSTKRLDSFLRNFAKGTLSEEQYADLEKADVLAKEQANREAAEARTKALEAAQEQNDGGKAMAWHHVRANVQRLVAQEGVSEEVALSLQPKTLGRPTAQDPFGYLSHEEEWIEAIRGYSDRQKKEAEPKPEIVQPRGGSSMTTWQQAQKTSKLLSSDEYDRFVAQG